MRPVRCNKKQLARRLEGRMKTNVTVFQPYHFVKGEKIFIESGPRHGDWLVLACDEKKVTLQCPVSKREFSWDRFCYHVEKREQEWPMND